MNSLEGKKRTSQNLDLDAAFNSKRAALGIPSAVVTSPHALVESPSTVLSVKMLCPPSVMGQIIGKGGVKMKQINLISGARIQQSKNLDCYPGTTERLLTLEGTRDALRKAMELLLTNIVEAKPGEIAPLAPNGMPLPNTNTMHLADGTLQMRLIVPNAASGTMIGKGGSVIKRMSESSSCRFQLGDEMFTPITRERVMVVSAPSLQKLIDGAQTAMLQMLSNPAVRNYEIPGSVYPADPAMQQQGFVGGGGGGGMMQMGPGMNGMPQMMMMRGGSMSMNMNTIPPAASAGGNRGPAGMYPAAQFPMQQIPGLAGGGGSQLQVPGYGMPGAGVGVGGGGYGQPYPMPWMLGQQPSMMPQMLPPPQQYQQHTALGPSAGGGLPQTYPHQAQQMQYQPQHNQQQQQYAGQGQVQQTRTHSTAGPLTNTALSSVAAGSPSSATLTRQASVNGAIAGSGAAVLSGVNSQQQQNPGNAPYDPFSPNSSVTRAPAAVSVSVSPSSTVPGGAAMMYPVQQQQPQQQQYMPQQQQYTQVASNGVVVSDGDLAGGAGTARGSTRWADTAGHQPQQQPQQQYQQPQQQQPAQTGYMYQSNPAASAEYRAPGSYPSPYPVQQGQHGQQGQPMPYGVPYGGQQQNPGPAAVYNPAAGGGGGGYPLGGSYGPSAR